MYTSKIKSRSILLLLILNFILGLGLLNSDLTFALDKQEMEYYDKEVKFKNIEDIIPTVYSKAEVVYKVSEGETLVVNKLQSENIERIKQEAIEKEKQRLEEERLLAMKTVYSSRNTSIESINVHTDLGVMNTITTDQMNLIIDYWDSKSGGTLFEGLGQAFIDASKISGLDPIYLLAHAGLESAWGNSTIAVDKHNYFGIGAFDTSPYESSHHMGGQVYDGIVNGADWISDHYYEAGQSTLYTMRYNNGTHEYCTSSTWMYNIANIMQTSYSLIL